MPEPFSVVIWTWIGSWWGRIRTAFHWVIGIFRIQSRIVALESQIKVLEKKNDLSPHRKCPICKERDFRLEDHYRFRRSPFDHQRYFHEKWRCYSCNHFEQTDTPEPGG